MEQVGPLTPYEMADFPGGWLRGGGAGNRAGSNDQLPRAWELLVSAGKRPGW
jgi:hypothetical protein